MHPFINTVRNHLVNGDHPTTVVSDCKLLVGDAEDTHFTVEVTPYRPFVGEKGPSTLSVGPIVVGLREPGIGMHVQRKIADAMATTWLVAEGEFLTGGAQ